MKNLKVELGAKNFGLALTRLTEFFGEAKDRDLDRLGVIKAFEFTYETGWKLLQKIANYEGESVNSPREAFRFALRNQMISMDVEMIWLAMIDDRNQTVHTYDVDLSRKIFQAIKTQYYPQYEILFRNITLKYIDEQK